MNRKDKKYNKNRKLEALPRLKSKRRKNTFYLDTQNDIKGFWDGTFFWYTCTEAACASKFKTNRDLKLHLMQKHNIGINKWFHCTVADCASKCKTNSHLKRHLMYKHNIGVSKWFHCTEADCASKFKTNGDLKQHLMRKHNIDGVKSLSSFSKRNGGKKKKIYVYINGYVNFERY